MRQSTAVYRSLRHGTPRQVDRRLLSSTAVYFVDEVYCLPPSTTVYPVDCRHFTPLSAAQ